MYQRNSLHWPVKQPWLLEIPPFHVRCSILPYLWTSSPPRKSPSGSAWCSCCLCSPLLATAVEHLSSRVHWSNGHYLEWWKINSWSLITFQKIGWKDISFTLGLFPLPFLSSFFSLFSFNRETVLWMPNFPSGMKGICVNGWHQAGIHNRKRSECMWL